MAELEEKIRENEEDLRELANADLPCSWIAERLLESTEGVSSYSPKESTEPSIGTDNELQNQSEPKGSVFAY